MPGDFGLEGGCGRTPGKGRFMADVRLFRGRCPLVKEGLPAEGSEAVNPPRELSRPVEPNCLGGPESHRDFAGSVADCKIY